MYPFARQDSVQFAMPSEEEIRTMPRGSPVPMAGGPYYVPPVDHGYYHYYNAQPQPPMGDLYPQAQPAYNYPAFAPDPAANQLPGGYGRADPDCYPPPALAQPVADPLAAQFSGMTMGPSTHGHQPPAPQQMAGQDQVANFLQHQSYDQLYSHHLHTRTLFVDDAFPANDATLQGSERGGREARHHRRNIEWLRPHDICKRLRLRKEPQMFVQNTTHDTSNKMVDRFDINQGELGNCWFLAALTTLAENDHTFMNVVPNATAQTFNPGQYAGIFRFRFWRFDQWVEIVIDDFLPTRGGELVYLRSNDKNEFWSALLEKAYAKLHGSYKALEGGLTLEAAVDFTGGIPEMIDMTTIVERRKRDDIYHAMEMAHHRKAFLGCALNNKKTAEARQMGLQSRHAYTITKVVTLNVRGKNVKLVRIRNPHGNNREWNGAWGDRDTNWQSIPHYERQMLEVETKSDGEFYMSMRDFMEYFGDVEMCHVTATSGAAAEKQFEVSVFRGGWRRGVNDGGCGNDGFQYYSKNPQFFITLNDPDPYDHEDKCPIIISLAQRQVKRKAEHAIGFKVYKCKDLSTERVEESYMRKNNSYARSDCFINMREVSTRLHLPPGRYCIIPSTFNRGEEGDFILRVFIEKSWAQASGQGGQQRFTRENRVSHFEQTYDPSSGFGGSPQAHHYPSNANYDPNTLYPPSYY